ncbi:hypothetical protein POM88_049618 [Heracleum sosnowskyi]|uniref:Uncharacterized protein n=1 Tax=Heracleum sosnowskyi TaxID=360622 RepID=A0AAD8GVZ1_9APIA|nr:hypothetical protein POM88_049618 [Heracleum sosnowskyi]
MGIVTRSITLKLQNLLDHSCQHTAFIDGSWMTQSKNQVKAGVGGVLKLMHFAGSVLAPNDFLSELEALSTMVEIYFASKWKDYSLRIYSDSACLIENVILYKKGKSHSLPLEIPLLSHLATFSWELCKIDRNFNKEACGLAKVGAIGNGLQIFWAD